MTNRDRLTELRYQMEKNSFILSLLESRIAVALHAESMGYSDTETALIAKISPQYVKLIRAIVNKFPKNSIEENAQELFDKIYLYSGYSKRDYSKFQMYDEKLVEEWFALKERERELRAGLIKKDEAVADFQHAYYTEFGVDIEIRELPQKPEYKQENETEPEEDNSKEMLQAFNKQLAEEALLTRMHRDGVIDEVICRKYMNAEELSQEAFQRILQIHREESQEELVESMAHTQKLEHQMELIAKLVNSEDITRNRAFEIMNINNDFHDFVEFLKILEIWEDKLHE